jgi:F0F1-type ATP synthase membrane subunit b/b'
VEVSYSGPTTRRDLVARVAGRHIMNRPPTSRITAIVNIAIGVALMSSVAIGSAQRSETEGIKETEQFVKAGSETSAVVGEAKLRIVNTLNAYNALVTEPSKNMKGDYKKLLKAVKDMNEKLSDARLQVSEMDGIATTYFAGRSATIKKIQNEQLRDQAEQRLAENQKQYNDVLTSLRQTGEALEPVRKDLADQINYLGSDLTPTATASLKPQADKLNERSAVAFDTADKAILAANTYFNSMRPAKSSSDK